MMIYRFIYRGIRYAVGTDLNGSRAWAVYAHGSHEKTVIDGIVTFDGGGNTFVMARAAAHTAIDARINFDPRSSDQDAAKAELKRQEN